MREGRGTTGVCFFGWAVGVSCEVRCWLKDGDGSARVCCVVGYCPNCLDAES